MFGLEKTLSTQMGYLFGWMSNLLTRPFFAQFWQVEDASTRLPIYHSRRDRFLWEDCSFSKIFNKQYNNSSLNLENHYTASIFFGMAESNCLDERRSENLTTSLVLCYYAFFTIY